MGRAVVVVVLVSWLSGCSFLRANCVNDWETRCSSKTAVIDYSIAGAAVIAGTAVYLSVPCDIDAGDCNQLDVLAQVVVPALVVGVTALASAIYGGSVADRCEQLARKHRTRR